MRIWTMIWVLLVVLIVCLACVALWVHMPLGVWTYAFIGLLVCLAFALIFAKFTSLPVPSWIAVVSVFLPLSVFAWIGMMQPSNDRHWNPEVAHIVDYAQDPANPNLITVKNVRNFHWRSETDYDIDWQTRTYDLSKLDSMDLVVSIWGNENIAHTFLTFGFLEGERLAFSVEIRKEAHEEFSSIGGFFRQFELSIIAATEADIIFTRSNIRNESVYLYPLTYDQEKMRSLFLTYLEQGRKLNQSPAWYNTLTSNCTTFIYKMVRLIDEDSRQLPMDYRVLVSGRLPSYLIELGVIRPHDTTAAWKDKAHLNPKVAKYGTIQPSEQDFSQAIREHLPRKEGLPKELPSF